MTFLHLQVDTIFLHLNCRILCEPTEQPGCNPPCPRLCVFWNITSDLRFCVSNVSHWGTPTPSPSASASSASRPHHHHHGISDTPAIIGGVVGGIGALLVAILIGVWIKRRRRKTNQTTDDDHYAVLGS